jgi:hypothetical protein
MDWLESDMGLGVLFMGWNEDQKGIRGGTLPRRYRQRKRGGSVHCPLSKSLQAAEYSLSINKMGGRLGNHLFQYSALLGLRAHGGYTPQPPLTQGYTKDIESDIKDWLEKSMQNQLHVGTHNPRPKQICWAPSCEQMATWRFPPAEWVRTFSLPLEDMELWGYFQSWRFFCNIDIRTSVNILLRKYVSPEAELESVLKENSVLSQRHRPKVGVHIRVGDMVKRSRLNRVFWTADLAYIEAAFSLLEFKYAAAGVTTKELGQDDAAGQQTRAPIFVVMCGGGFAGNADDLNECKKLLLPLMASTSSSISTPSSTMDGSSTRTIIFSHGRSGAQDLALLSICDDVVITSGTFGWWGGFLAAGLEGVHGVQNTWQNKTVVAYHRQIQEQALPSLAGRFDEDDYFPPGWTLLEYDESQ